MEVSKTQIEEWKRQELESRPVRKIKEHIEDILIDMSNINTMSNYDRGAIQHYLSEVWVIVNGVRP